MIKYQCSGWLKYKKGSSDLRGFTYTYDAAGNIQTVTTGGTNVPAAAASKTYAYDAQGQLATETNGGASRAYAYDTVGNIRSVTTDGAVIKSFGYTNPSWPDLLTSVTVGGTTKDILYEGQTQTSGVPSSGNPVTYYNGKDYTFTWTKGRQLASATVDGKQVSYTYDMSGVRSNKQVGDTTYTYTTLSGKVMRQTWGDNNALEFVYDDGNQPFAVIYKHGQTTELYYYVLNAQGDVSAILDSSGKLAASYDYDAWGNCTVYDSSAKVLTDPTSIANLNPLRYRGYYYDAETGFYYLQSRYYDPAICRFINADTFATTDANGFLSANMFAYCENNPIIGVDPTGEFLNTIFGAVAGSVIAVATREEGETWQQAALRGAVTGMIAGFALDASIATAGAAGVLIATLGGVASGVADKYWSCANVGRKPTGGEVVSSALAGAVINTAFGAAGRVAGRAVGNTVKTVVKAVKTNFVSGFVTKSGRFLGRKAAKTVASNVRDSFAAGALTWMYNLLFSKR